MKLTWPTGRAGQLLALGLTLALPATVWVGVVDPFLEWHRDRAERLEQREAIAQRMLSLQAALPMLRERATSIANNGSTEPALLEGDSDSVASASLQERLQAMFIQAGAQLNSVETLQGEDVGAYRRIRLQVSFNATWPVLMDLLKDIRATAPVLLVDELHVQPALHRMSIAPGTFDISCNVFSFRAGAVRVTSR
jgi:general secretion pathway protein M